LIQCYTRRIRMYFRW